jgi:hypothetical protein
VRASVSPATVEQDVADLREVLLTAELETVKYSYYKNVEAKCIEK